MTKLVGNIHVYRTGQNGEPRTNTPHVDDTAATALATGVNATTQTIAQGDRAKSQRQSTLWHNKLFAVTKNVHPSQKAATSLGALAATAFGGAAGTTLGTPAAQSVLYVAKAIDQWEKNAPVKYRDDYHRVAQQIRQCLYNPDLTRLDISNPNITSLPPFPAHVTKATLHNCPRLQTAPDFSHCQHLAQLSLLGCSSLTEPPGLSGCSRLTTLSMPRCTALVRPPDVSGCTALSVLDLGECSALVDPPDVSGCAHLTTLTLLSCRSLTSFPDISTCTELQQVLASGCAGITTLPRGWTALRQLRQLELSGVPLTSVPADLLSLPRRCMISLNVNYFSEAVRSQLNNTLNLQGYTGPVIMAELETAPVRKSANLKEAVQFWRNAASPSGKAQKSGWGSFQKEAGADHFRQFLDRLSETGEYRNPRTKANFIERVGKLLDQLKLDKELRKHCFSQAEPAINTCGDRVALALLDMEITCELRKLETEVESGKFDRNPAALCEEGKRFHRLEQLREMARQKVAGLNFVDEIEVYLGYLVKLSKELDLPVRMDTMLYPDWSHITEDDMTKARNKLGASEDGEADAALLGFLANWNPSRMLLTRLVPQSTMSEIELQIKQKVAGEKDELHGKIAELLEDPESEDNKRKAKDLMASFNRVDGTVRTEFMATLVEKHLMNGKKPA